jgi:hypothetical protein
MNYDNLSLDINKDNDKIILKKKKLIEMAKNLSKIEYLEIFEIIKNDKCQYSENKNGIFINLNNVDEETIDKIFNFINFIKHKKEDLLKHEEILNTAKKNISIEVIPYEKKINDTYNEIILEDELSDNDEPNNYSNYLHFSSDEDEDLENKISLKKKKIKHSGKKAKMIKSIKDGNLKNRTKKTDE